jgi:carbamoyltransferase
MLLGITNNDDASACLVEGEKIVSAVQEERFSRKKFDNAWPMRSINYVLKSADLKLSDLKGLAYAWSSGFDEDELLVSYLERTREFSAEDHEGWNSFVKRCENELQNDQARRQEFVDFARGANLGDRVFFVDHHEAHAMGAFLCSGYNEALVVSADGRGDYKSLTISYCGETGQALLHKELTADSLGFFYGRITKLLGMTPNKHEGKVTGLAAHGDPTKCRDLMEKMIELKNGRIRANLGKWYQPSYSGYSEELIQSIKKYEPEDVAAAAQVHLEDLLTGLVRQYLPKTGEIPVCVAGGIFGNVRLNQRIREIRGVRSIFVLPCMGDGGLSLAAAVTANKKYFGKRVKLTTMALGPSVDKAAVKRSLEKLSSEVSVRTGDSKKQLIECLQKNFVVGVIRGRMEFGPRALCNRSLIYHANDQSVNHWLNKRLARTEFMPFAPVVPENLAKQCFVGWEPADVSSRYMTITYECTELLRRMCPAVVHVDGSARPQIVTESDDAFMYSVLNAWYDLTGQPALINTSFNRHDEPIIETAEQGLSTLLDGVIDALFVDNTHAVFRGGSFIASSSRATSKSAKVVTENGLGHFDQREVTA